MKKLKINCSDKNLTEFQLINDKLLSCTNIECDIRR